LLVKKGVGSDRTRRGQEQRVAIGSCARDLGGADIACRAANILYDRRLTPFAAELVCEQARQRVGTATRGVGDDDTYQPRALGVLRAALLGWKEDGKRGERHESDLDPSHRR